jgi:hypothetical protein
MLGRRLLCVGLVALSAGACGGESGAFTDAPVALGDLPPKYAAAACTAYENCMGADLMKLFLNGADCAAVTEQRILNGTFPMIQSRIDQGTMRYDGAKAQACLNAIAARTCATFNDRDPPECLAAIDGTVDLGGDCTLDDDCKGSALCRSTTGTCPGKCTALLVAGQACAKNDNCASGLVCSSETKMCVQPVGADQKCEYGQPPCAPGLLCLGKDDTAKTSGTCKSSAQAFSADEGAVCDPAKGQLCKTGLSCAAAGVTVVPPAITFKCVKAGSYAAGLACKPAFPDACATGTYCKNGTGALALDGVCTALPQSGEACGKDSQCQPNTVCVAGTCRSLVANGVSCTGDAMCYSERCGSGGCEARVACK